jgi:phosphoglycolate phosphatase-like HAD superfamily hydrolase
MNTSQELIGLRAENEFFIAIDSDGCVFDSMETKHKECFCPAFINNFNLQSVSTYAREAWDFVNLYSQDRGCNRFFSVLKTMDILRDRPEIKNRGTKVMELTSLKKWTQKETKLGNAALKAEIDRTNDAELKTVYQWSLDVDEAVKKIVRGVPPFPLFRESLDKMRQKADVIVISQAPTETLLREWADWGIDKLVRFIAGQEIGSKSENLESAAKNKYPLNKILMIGDAPGDLKAANSIGALFYPIVPGDEDNSWKRFYHEALDRFFNMNYEGTYQENLLVEFHKSLPEKAPWH